MPPATTLPIQSLESARALTVAMFGGVPTESPYPSIFCCPTQSLWFAIGVLRETMTNDDGRNLTKTRIRNDSQGRPITNSLLLSVPDHEFEELRPQLEF